ncbi:MAG: DUF1269 domain-containing protein [Thermomicrobiales bacterium]
MATLLAITYPEADRAEQAMESLDWSAFDRLINIKAACWITKAGNELMVHPRGHPGAGKAALGGALGLLVGGLMTVPVVGIAAGAAIGIHKGRHKDIGIDEAFVASIGEQLEADGSAIIMLVEEGADTAKAAVDLAQYGGTVQSSDLSPEQMDRFQTLLDQATDDAPSDSDAASA